jgi:hypothetical protein
LQTSETITKISEALAKAQAEFKPVGKSGTNHQQGYRFADLDDFFRAVREVLSKHGLSLTSSVTEIVDLPTRKSLKDTPLYGCRVRLVTRLLHPSGEWIEAAAYGEGQDAGDKAPYKAITGARKYALACLLGLATVDDPERDEQAAPTTTASTPAPTRRPQATKRPSADQIGRLKTLAEDQRLPADARQHIRDVLARDLTADHAAALITRAERRLRSNEQAA